MFEFTRDSRNKILSRTFYYLDENGNKANNFPPEKWIYIYTNDYLSKVKKLGSKFSEKPDDKSDYRSYSYDRKGREISETIQFYYDGAEPSFQQTKTTYNDTTKTSIAIKRDRKSLLWTTKTIYTVSQQPLSQKLFGDKYELLLEKIFIYDSKKQLKSYQVKTFGTGVGTECLDGNNFLNAITYTTKGLISKILHQFENTVCEMRFSYK